MICGLVRLCIGSVQALCWLWAGSVLALVMVLVMLVCVLWELGDILQSFHLFHLCVIINPLCDGILSFLGHYCTRWHYVTMKYPSALALFELQYQIL